jgi:hypothetical protein
LPGIGKGGSIYRLARATGVPDGALTQGSVIECLDEVENGNSVFVIEYRDQDFEKGCNEFPELSTVLRDLDVSTPDSVGYKYEGC